jgi:hypothetical protein
MKMMNVVGFDDEHDEGEMNVNVFSTRFNIMDLIDGRR